MKSECLLETIVNNAHSIRSLLLKTCNSTSLFHITRGLHSSGVTNCYEGLANPCNPATWKFRVEEGVG